MSLFVNKIAGDVGAYEFVVGSAGDKRRAFVNNYGAVLRNFKHGFGERALVVSNSVIFRKFLEILEAGVYAEEFKHFRDEVVDKCDFEIVVAEGYSREKSRNDGDNRTGIATLFGSFVFGCEGFGFAFVIARDKTDYGIDGETYIKSAEDVVSGVEINNSAREPNIQAVFRLARVAETDMEVGTEQSENIEITVFVEEFAHIEADIRFDDEFALLVERISKRYERLHENVALACDFEIAELSFECIETDSGAQRHVDGIERRKECVDECSADVVGTRNDFRYIKIDIGRSVRTDYCEFCVVCVSVGDRTEFEIETDFYAHYGFVLAEAESYVEVLILRKAFVEVFDFCNGHGDFSAVITAVFVGENHSPQVVENGLSDDYVEVGDIENISVLNKSRVVEYRSDKTEQIGDFAVLCRRRRGGNHDFTGCEFVANFVHCGGKSFVCHCLAECLGGRNGTQETANKTAEKFVEIDIRNDDFARAYETVEVNVKSLVRTDIIRAETHDVVVAEQFDDGRSLRRVSGVDIRLNMEIERIIIVSVEVYRKVPQRAVIVDKARKKSRKESAETVGYSAESHGFVFGVQKKIKSDVEVEEGIFRRFREVDSALG